MLPIGITGPTVEHTTVEGSTVEHTTVQGGGGGGGDNILVAPSLTIGVGRSLDGVTWETIPGINLNWRRSAYSPDLDAITVVSSNGTDRIMYSFDKGLTWTNVSTPLDSAPLSSVIWLEDAGLFIVGRDNPATTLNLMRSPTPTSWGGTLADFGFNFGVMDLAYSPTLGRLVAVGFGGGSNNAAWSDAFGADGTWTLVTSAFGGGEAKAVTWVPFLDLFIVVAQNGATARSANGTSWTAGTDISSGTVVDYGAAFADNGSIVVAVVDAGGIWSSPDGATWTQRSTTAYRGVCWSGTLGLFVAVGGVAGQKVRTSPDGINWTVQTDPPTSPTSLTTMSSVVAVNS